MPPDAAIPQPQSLLDPSGWIEGHPVIVIWVAAFCVWVSVALIIRMWFLHRKTPTIKKLLWAAVLLIPGFGWLCYSGCFHPLGSINTPCPQEHDWGAGTGGGWSDGGGHP